MENTQINNLVAHKNIRCILVGGFLGAGKTTALLRLANMFLARGLKPGIIINDQSTNLVDTSRLLKSAKGVPVMEIGNGCFCCQFDGLNKVTGELLGSGVDVLLGEPVGSCTDLIATVINPLKAFYPNLQVSPFSVLIDPLRLKEYLWREVESFFPEEVLSQLSYLMRQQMEEADMLVLNKIDLLSPEEVRHIEGQISAQFPRQQVLAISAKEGQGVDQWLKLLLSGLPSGQYPLKDLDYDQYAKAEALLGWLNEEILLQALQPFDADTLVRELMTELGKVLNQQRADIAHLKIICIAGEKVKRANLTKLNEEPDFGEERIGSVKEARLILNARVPLEPGELENLVSGVIKALCQAFGIQISILALQSFRPPYPHPSLRLT